MIVGLWQMADQERNGKPFDLDQAADMLADDARSGFDTFDMADHYGSAEIVVGRAACTFQAEGRPPPTILTKWCPEPGPMDAGTVRRGVETALERLGRDQVDVMQFHCWHYQDSRYLEALRDEGLIGGVGLTNVDAQHLRMLLKHGVRILSNQVCFSLLDRRAAGDLGDVTEEDAEAQAVFILDKIAAAIGALGGSLDDVVRTRIYLRNHDDWEAVSRVHHCYFADTRPANTLVTAGLIGPYLVEIEAEAELSG